MPNYLITGGAGFIGSNLAQRLVEEGEAVRILDDFSTGRRENLTDIEEKIEIVEGDIRDGDVCRAATEDIDFVLHEAAIPSVQRSIEEPVATTEVNVIGIVQLLNACVESKVQRVVCAASSSAYGDQEVESKTETLLPLPLSPYATSKLAGEYFCQAFGSSFGLETICLRYFNVFGPNQDPNSHYSAVIPLFINAILEDRQPTVHGDGMQSRDFTYIENVIEANLLAARAPKSATGRVYNAACGSSYTLLDLVAKINEIVGKKIEPVFGPSRAGDVRHSLAAIGLAEEHLGYKPTVDFDEGLRRTIEWYRAEK